MKRNILALVLSVLLVLSLLAGCGNSSAVSTTETSSLPQVSTAQVSDTSTNNESYATSVEEITAETPALPLTEELETITMWMPWSPDVGQYVDNPNDCSFWKELEARTNVHVDFTLANAETATEQFSLVTASGSYPDIFNGFSSRYVGGAEAGLNDDVVIDLMEYSELMPNLMAVLEDPNIASFLITDGGYLVEPANVYESMTLYTDGPQIRQDWLDEQGLDTPVTYDDWHDVLTVFKNAYDLATPFFLPPEGAMVGNFLSSGYGVASISAYNVFTPFYVDNGTVKFGPLESGYESYLTMLHQWYEEGLINNDFVSMSDRDAKRGEVMGDNCGIWIGDAPDISSYEETANNGMKISPIADPSVDEAHTGYMNKVGTYTTTDGYAVSTQAKNVELIAKWIDYQYSDEGSFLANYGIEGEGYTLDDNGQPQLTELVTNNPDGITMISAMQIYMQYQGPFVNDWTRNLADYNEVELSAIDIWNITDAPGGISQWPTSMNLSAEESDQFNAAWSDINTYFCEMSLKFITGDEPLENFAEFCSKLEAMDIASCISAKQACYDRYTSR